MRQMPENTREEGSHSDGKEDKEDGEIPSKTSDVEPHSENVRVARSTVEETDQIRIDSIEDNHEVEGNTGSVDIPIDN